MTEPSRSGTRPPPGAPVTGGFVVRPLVLWGLLLLLVAAVGASPWVREQVRASVVHEAEPYTGLAFANPLAPLDCAGGTAQITIANHEGRDVTYSWTATVTGQGSGRHQAAGRVRVKDGATATASVATGAPITSGALSVALTGRPERLEARCPAVAS